MSVLVASLSVVGPALGATKQTQDKAGIGQVGEQATNRQLQEKAARKACLAGDYTKGVELLADLFVESREPTYVFNQGRCFEQNRRYEDAIARFQEYLRAAGPKLSPEDKESAEQHIRSCRDLFAQERASVAAPATPQPFAPSPQQSPPIVVQPAPPPGPLSAGRGLRIGGIVVASVGAAALVSGVLLNLQANSVIKDMEAKTDGYSPGKKSDFEAYRTLSWAGYGIGAACVVTGAALYGIGLKAKSNSSSSSADIALVPTVGVGQVGAAVTGAFQ